MSEARKNMIETLLGVHALTKKPSAALSKTAKRLRAELTEKKRPMRQTMPLAA